MKPTLIIFSRYPVPGRVKTRLAKGLGPAVAAEAQRYLTERTVQVALKAQRKQAFDVEIHGAGGSGQQWQRWLGRFPVRFRPQRGKNLGQRLARAAERTFCQKGGPLVLLGADTADLEAEHLEAAFQGLARKQVVFGPSTDGGYFLAGLQKPIDIFSRIDWSTDKVLPQSLERVRRLGLSHTLVKPATDVDTPETACKMLPAIANRPYLSVIIPALNEETGIAATIASARCRDGEIIVADGGSQDGTIGRAKTAGARVMPCPRGRARQMNQAAAGARGRVLLFLHADTLLPPAFVNQIFEILLDPGIVLGAFAFKTDREGPGMRLIEKAAGLRCRFLNLPFGDQAFFLRRTDFFNLGRFAQVPLAEDLLLARRAARRGRIGLAPGPAVTSARRWQKLGLVRTTMINWLVTAACLAGIAPDRLAGLYRRKKGRPK